MKKRQLKLLAAALAAAVMAGCGGSGTTGTSNLPPAISKTVSGHYTGPLAHVGFKIKIPPKHHRRHHRRSIDDMLRPNYLTPAIRGISVSVSDATNPYFGSVFDPITPQANYCTGDGVNTALVCTIALQAPPGMDTFTVETWDTVQPAGYVISDGTLTQSITLNAANQVNIATSGAVVHLQIALDDMIPAIGASASIPLRITALDGDDYAIVGNFDFPLALSDSDTSGATSVPITSLASASDFSGLHLSYNGAVIGSSATPQITVSTESPLADVNNGGPFSSYTALFPGGNGLKATPGLLHFSSPTAAGQALSLTGISTTTPFTVQNTADPNGDPACSIVNVTGTSPIFTITPSNSGAGVCTLWASDNTYNTTSGANGAWLPIPLSVSPGIVP